MDLAIVHTMPVPVSADSLAMPSWENLKSSRLTCR
jgi:hypothetical protein